MADPQVLSMLYEILVAQSKYESRGIDYRTRLKANYYQLLKENRAHREVQLKFPKQPTNKLLVSLADSVRVMDPTEMQTTELELCYGINQYVFPKIPDFDNLDSKFVSKWHKFYNVLPVYQRVWDRKKRANEKKHFPMSKKRNVKDSESSSESDSSETKLSQPVLMTEQDFDNPNVSVKTEDPYEQVNENAQEKPSVIAPEFAEVDEGHVKLPILMNKDVEVTDDSIVFGLMEDDKLCEWVSTSSFDTYKELYRQIYFYDSSLRMGSLQREDLASFNNDEDSDYAKESETAEMAQKHTLHVKTEGACAHPEKTETIKVYRSDKHDRKACVHKVEKSGLHKLESTGLHRLDDSRLEFSEGTASHRVEDSESQEVSSNTNSSDEVNDEMIGTKNFYKKSKPLTLPGNYKQNTDHFDPDAIFGNYYCPLSSGSNENIKEECADDSSLGRMRRRAKEKRKNQTTTSTTLVDSLVKVDTFNSNNSNETNTKMDILESGDRAENTEKEESSNLMNLKSFSLNFMEVDSIYSCNDMGNFEVRCSAKIKHPFASGVMKGKMEGTLGVYQELQVLLKKLFSLKKKISGNCSVCSGWNLLHGIAHSFCEYCEDKLVNRDPEILLKIFEIRRYLVSILYPIVGYKFQVLELFKSGELAQNWKELLKTQKVSIQSLTEVGSSFPKASFHDSRYLPSPITLPYTICDAINTFQFPKTNQPCQSSHLGSNGHLTTVGQLGLNAQWQSSVFAQHLKDELLTPINTPTKQSPFSSMVMKQSPFNNTLSSNTIHSINSYMSSFRGSNGSGNREQLNIETVSCKDNGDKKLESYGLMDMVNYRRYYRAKMLNELLEELFNAYHARSPHQRSVHLVNNYVNILRNGHLLSTEFVFPENVSLSSDEEETESSEEEAAEARQAERPETRYGEKQNERQETRNSEKNVEKKKEQVKDAPKIKEHKPREAYYDEDTSFVLSRLPMDTDMIKSSFYHRGIFQCKTNGLKTYTFAQIAKIFGFKESLYNETSSPTSKDDGVDRENSVSSSSEFAQQDVTPLASNAMMSKFASTGLTKGLNTMSATMSSKVQVNESNYNDNTGKSEGYGDHDFMTGQDVKGAEGRKWVQGAEYGGYGKMRESGQPINNNRSVQANCNSQETDIAHSFQHNNTDNSKTMSSNASSCINTNDTGSMKIDSPINLGSINAFVTNMNSANPNLIATNNSIVNSRTGAKENNQVGDVVGFTDSLKVDNSHGAVQKAGENYGYYQLSSGIEVEELSEMSYNVLSFESGSSSSSGGKHNEASGLGAVDRISEGDLTSELSATNEDNGIGKGKLKIVEASQNKTKKNSKSVKSKSKSSKSSKSKIAKNSNSKKMIIAAMSNGNMFENGHQNSHGNPMNVEFEAAMEAAAVARSSTNGEDNSGEFSYNWHEHVARHLNKKSFLVTNDNGENSEMISKLLSGEVERAGKESKLQLFKALHKYRLLQNMHTQVLNNLIATQKLKIGFPTSLEMYMLNIPDSIMDCGMYGGVGKGFMYSLDAIVHNLSLLSTIIRIGTVSEKRKKSTK